jgi:hypothetical protein
MSKRNYFGNLYLKKCYRGEKSINLVVEKEEGLKLAKAILAAALEKKKFDIAIYDYRKSKDDRVYATITSVI